MPSHFRLGDLASRPQQPRFDARDRSWDAKFLPRIHTDTRGFERVFNLAKDEGSAGLDLEYGPGGKPSIIGIASRDECAAIPWGGDGVYWARRLASLGLPLVGHAVTTADRPVLDAAAEIVTPLTQWEDTMVLFYLLYADTCRAAGKDEDTDDSSIGLLGLWTMASIYTRLWNWKRHRGAGCEGPCPRCKPFDYCAVDAWAGLAAFEPMKREYLALGCSWDLYRAIIRRTDLAYRMTQQGVKIDRAYIAGLDAEFEKHKAALYPYEVTAKGKKRYLTPSDFEGSLFAGAIDTASLCRYNPASPKQIIEWFDGRGVSLKDVSAGTILLKLESVCRKYGVSYEIERGVLHVTDEETWQPPNEVVGELYKLHHWKSEGKGVKSWFDDRYFEAGDLIRPRWITTGTAFGRWSSSTPNFSNIPARGFGAMIKKGIIPRDPSLVLVKGDASQLELRKLLHRAGVEAPRGDIFEWFLGLSGGAFAEATKLTSESPREVAKKTSHAADYGEGLQVLSGADLASDRIQKEIDYGARIVFRDWEFRGGVVSFTGANLAQRLFGSKTLADRKRALHLQELYFSASPFDKIRDLQRSLGEELEARRGILTVPGRFLRFYGDAEDDLKGAWAGVGQGESADYMQGLMELYDGTGIQPPILFVHDELVFERPRTDSLRTCYEFMLQMTQETKMLPGFSCPGKFGRGDNWKECQPLTADVINNQ